MTQNFIEFKWIRGIRLLVVGENFERNCLFEKITQFLIICKLQKFAATMDMHNSSLTTHLPHSKLQLPNFERIWLIDSKVMGYEQRKEEFRSNLTVWEGLGHQNW